MDHEQHQPRQHDAGEDRTQQQQIGLVGRDASDDELAELHRFKTARYAQLMATGACPLRPGVASAIRAAVIRGQRLAIATTTSRANVDALLAATLGKNGTHLFSAIVAGDEVCQKKPAPDVYLKVLGLLEASNLECLAIEDSHNGLFAASRAGIPTLIARSAYFRDTEFDSALAIINSLDDLVNFNLPLDRAIEILRRHDLIQRRLEEG